MHDFRHGQCRSLRVNQLQGEEARLLHAGRDQQIARAPVRSGGLAEVLSQRSAQRVDARHGLVMRVTGIKGLTGRLNDPLVQRARRGVSGQVLRASAQRRG